MDLKPSGKGSSSTMRRGSEPSCGKGKAVKFSGYNHESSVIQFYVEGEKYVKALFSLASKIAPSVIFIDEVDSMLGRRENPGQHEVMSKMKNEFMVKWVGLHMKDKERVLVHAVTNRPFDRDEAVIRRLPLRFKVGLPDTPNFILAKEELAPNFDLAVVGNIKDGYSGSDLKDFCLNAAYCPIREILDKKKKGKGKAIAVDEVTQIWEAHPKGYFKLNTDGTWKDDVASGGGVIRSDNGAWLADYAVKFHVRKPVEAELLALRYGLEMAKEKGIKKLKVEVDAKSIALMLDATGKYTSHELGAIIYEVGMLLRGRWEVELIHVGKDKSNLAHTLVQYARSLENEENVFDVVPEFAIEAYNEDINNLPVAAN